jgi:hypothetical protein
VAALTAIVIAVGVAVFAPSVASADVTPAGDTIPDPAAVTATAGRVTYEIDAVKDDTGILKPKKSALKKGKPDDLKTAKKKAFDKAAQQRMKSFRDSSQVPLQDGVAQFSATASPVEAPNADQMTDCLSHPESQTRVGNVLNRYFWCQHADLRVNYQVLDNGVLKPVGSSTIGVYIAAEGMNTARAVRVFFRAEKGTVRYDWTASIERPFPETLIAPYQPLKITAGCTESIDYCHTTRSDVSMEWQQWNNTDQWFYWDVYSHEGTSAGVDKVQVDGFYVAFDGSSKDYVGKAGATDTRAIRCDSANYFTFFGTNYNQACVLYEVIPHLQYSVNDLRVADVAQHIWTAQHYPDDTWPKESHPKKIPGLYVGDRTGPGLHRIDGAGAQATQNEAVRTGACSRTAPYNATTGLPPYDPSLQCDEYPFHASAEGAANTYWDFSVAPVNASQNQSAGGLLNWYFFADRILRVTDVITENDDEFWVQIVTCGTCGGGGGTPAPKPVVNIDPGSAGRLGGSFIQPDLLDKWSDATLNTELTSMKNLHLSHLVVQWAANDHDKRAGGQKTAVYPTQQPGYVRNTSTDVIERTLRAADAAGVDVWVGLPVSDDWWNVYAYDPWWLDNEATTAKAFAHELWDKYHSHASFKGWYLSFELDNVHFGTASAQNNMISFYQNVIGELHVLSNNLPVAIAPFYNGVNTQLPGWQDPTAWGYTWKHILENVDVDVIALQDGVGAGHATPATLGTWFSAMRDAITASGSNARLFADTETFIMGASGLQPMSSKGIVSAINAVKGYVAAFWSFSFNHYQSPRSTFATSAYFNAYNSWAQAATGDGTDGSLPSKPGTLKAVANDPQTITLSWANSTDAGSGVAGYHIYRDNELVADKLSSAGGFIDRQLDGSRTYSYQVKAFDGSGNESTISNTASATTSAMPAAPTNYGRCGAASGQPGCTYTTSVPADPSYPDTGGNSLTDGKHGPALYGPEWQGRNAAGIYSFTIDLMANKTIKEINSTYFQVRPDYAFLPPKVSYSVSKDNVTFTQVAAIDIPAVSASMQTKTYRSINLNQTGRYVKVTIDCGTAWTMLDEIEVRGA